MSYENGKEIQKIGNYIIEQIINDVHVLFERALHYMRILELNDLYDDVKFQSMVVERCMPALQNAIGKYETYVPDLAYILRDMIFLLRDELLQTKDMPLEALQTVKDVLKIRLVKEMKLSTFNEGEG